MAPYAFVLENLKPVDFSGTVIDFVVKLAPIGHSDKRYLLTSKFCPRDYSALPRGSVPCTNSLNIFFSEGTGPIEVKLHMEPPWVWRTKVCS